VQSFSHENDLEVSKKIVIFQKNGCFSKQKNASFTLLHLYKKSILAKICIKMLGGGGLAPPPPPPPPPPPNQNS